MTLKKNFRDNIEQAQGLLASLPLHIYVGLDHMILAPLWKVLQHWILLSS